MRYLVDNDLHIHSKLSSCSRHEEQTPENILAYAEKNGLSTICLADHMWDDRIPGASKWYAPQTYEHIRQSLPLPQSDKVRFLFGCETELDRHLTLGISREVIDELDFVIIPTNHLHMHGFTLDGSEGVEERARLCVERLDAVLDMDLPFHKIGIAHFTGTLTFKGRHREVYAAIPEAEYHRRFAKAAQRGVGIELNFGSLSLTDETRPIELLPYQIAKAEGCKFYFGSDAHTPGDFVRAKENFENIVDLLGLTEEDKFRI